MEGEPRENKKEGWQNETDEKSASIAEFLKAGNLKDKDYHSREDLHFSGGVPAILQAIAKGESAILSVEVLYENEQPTQIRAVCNLEGEKGGNVDVYLKNQALADYLASSF